MSQVIPKILTITGPSGSGKSEIVKKLLELDPNLGKVISHTTREPRPNEVEGVDYYFVDEQYFKDNVFMEAVVSSSGETYGTSEAEMVRIFDSGKTPVLVMDPMGVDSMINYYEVFTVYIDASPEILVQRLMGRFLEKAKNPSKVDLVVEAKKITICLTEEIFWAEEDYFELHVDNSENSVDNIALKAQEISNGFKLFSQD